MELGIFINEREQMNQKNSSVSQVWQGGKGPDRLNGLRERARKLDPVSRDADVCGRMARCLERPVDQNKKVGREE